MLKNIKTLSVLVGLLVANVYGAQRMKDLSALSMLPLADACSQEWSLLNPDRKSLYDILVAQRQRMLARLAAVDSIVVAAFDAVDINASVALNVH